MKRMKTRNRAKSFVLMDYVIVMGMITTLIAIAVFTLCIAGI